MIEKIIFIKNIGKFADYRAQGEMSFRRLTLIYAENARGKTTLTAVRPSAASPVALRAPSKAPEGPWFIFHIGTLLSAGSCLPYRIQPRVQLNSGAGGRR